MASDHRQVKNFSKFPGKLVRGTGQYEFPTLYRVDSLNRVRSWFIAVRLIKNDQPRQTGIDWSLLAESQVPIEKQYFSSKNVIQLPAGTIAQIYTTGGITGGKQTRRDPTYQEQGANMGRANERNAFQQALIAARSEWLKKKDRGMVEDPTGVCDETINGNNSREYPMLASKWEDAARYIKYPAFAQEKLDGNRMCAFIPYVDCGWERVELYSRKLKDFPDKDYLKYALYDTLNAFYDDENDQSIKLDGELFKPGLRIQDISGMSRRGVRAEREKARTAAASIRKDYLEFHVYDCYYPLEKSTPFAHRLLQLNEVFEFLKQHGNVKIPQLKSKKASDIIVQHVTHRVADEKAVKQLFESIMEKDGEGIIVRNAAGKYLANSTTRSKDLIKMKKRQTDEYKCVGFTEGTKGKDKGAVIWIAETADGIQFNVTPKDISYEERRKIYEECKTDFNAKYNGRMLTVEYVDLSKDQVPQHAKALVFRDYE